MVYTVNGVNYTRRKKIPVTGAGSGAQTNYQIKLTALWADAMQADYDDVRFTKADMQTLIDAWLESKTDSTTADIWAEFPTTPADGVVETEAYMYFGNVGVASDWDGAATFLQYHGAASSAYQDGTTIGPNDIAYETRVKATGTLSAAFLSCAIGVNVPVGEEGGDQLRSLIHNPSNDSYYASWNNGSQTWFNVAPGITDGAYHRYVITFDGSTATYYRDSVSKGTNNTNLPNEAMGLRFAIKGGAGAQEWSFIRKYVANPPTAAFGTEEHQRRIPMMM